MILFIIQFLIPILCLMVAYHVRLRYGRSGRLLNKLPGPPGIPFFGNVFNFLVSKQEDLQPILDKVNEKYYPIYRLWGIQWGVVNILNPDDAEALLTSSKHIEKSTVYKFIKPWLGDGLLISKGLKWQNRRKILTHAFHFNVLQKYLEVLLEHGNKLVGSLKKDDKEKKVDLIPFLTYHTLSAICETAMGTSLQCMDANEVEKYRKAVFFMGELAIYRLLRPWFLMDFIFDNFTIMGWKQRKALKTLHAFSRNIINERTEYHRQTGGEFLKEMSAMNVNKENEDVSFMKVKKKRLSMLDLLIAASWNGLIDEEGIAEEVDTFIFEGHDTSAMALVFIIQIFAEYEDVQEKARNEVNEIWKLCDGKIDINLLNQCSYLERCIREIMRLYPSVPFISRLLRDDLQTKNYLVPAGVIVNLYIYEIHRDPQYWPEPNKFDPDRFLPEKILERHPFSYIPFSGGPRNCIGQKFAMMELKVFTAFILKNFKLSAILKHNDTRKLPDLVYRPLEKIEVIFRPIN